MVLWIESQDTAVIFVVLCALCYGLAAMIFLGATLVARRRIASEMKAITPALLHLCQ